MGNGVLNPFLLGDFERSSKTAVQYAETLLERYMFEGRAAAKTLAHDVASRLCEGYYDHGYPIQRREAQEILKLNIDNLEGDLWKKTTELILAYDKMMESQNIAIIMETSKSFEITHWPTRGS